MQVISDLFLVQASDILGDTNYGLTTSKILRILSSFAVDYNVDIPHSALPIKAPNKRTALLENLRCFNSNQQYRILTELFKEESQVQREVVNNFAKLLRQRYGMLDEESVEFDKALSSDTSHWLSRFPTSLKLYNTALDKRRQFIYERNLLDDLRLSLELLLKSILNNNKSLENQKNDLGIFVDKIGGSQEFTNMFVRLVDYFCKYQNEHVKHNDKVIELEIDFIVDIASSFMKAICRCV